MVTSRLSSRLTQRIGKHVTVTTSNPIVLDMERAAQIAGEALVGEIQRAAAAGRTPSGAAMAGYSDSYAEALREGGEGTNVDLTLTGGKDGLLGDVHYRVVQTPYGADVIAYVGTGRSPQVVLADGRARRTGKLGPPHDRLAAWLHKGTPRMPPRPWLGLSADGAKRIRRLLEKAGLMRALVARSRT